MMPGWEDILQQIKTLQDKDDVEFLNIFIGAAWFSNVMTDTQWQAQCLQYYREYTIRYSQNRLVF